MGKSTITYNGSVIAETEESGSVNVIYDGNTIATVAEGETKTLKCAGKVMRSNLYIGARALLCEMSKMISDIIVAVASSFPAEPSAYNLIANFTASQTWTAPENGWFQIEVFGASGNGGNGVTTGSSSNRRYYSGAGGGGGGYACSRIKLNAGDTIALTVGAIGGTSSASINSTIETYPAISVTSGATGGNGTPAPAVGGTGGVASGGNYANANGGDGNNGDGPFDIAGMPGGKGGEAGYTGGNVGGQGGSGTTQTSGKAGKSGSAGFIKIYRGNTNAA